MTDLQNMTAAMALCSVALFCLAKLVGHFGLAGAQAPPVRATALMTNAERRVMGYIEQALPNARIHAQVSMGALMQPARRLNKRAATIARNRFSAKRVDFVAEDRATGEIIAIIELDDWSHNAATNHWRDTLTARAGYITIRLPAAEHQTTHSVHDRVHQALYVQRPSETFQRQSARRRRPS